MNREFDLSLPFIHSALVDSFIPRQWLGTGDIDEIRARILLVSVFALLIWGPVFAVIYFVFTKVLILSGILIAGTFLIALTPVLLRLSQSFAITGNWMAINLWLVIVSLALNTGGMEAPVIPWLLALPLLAVIFADRRSALVWLIVVLVSTMVLYSLHSRGAFHQHIPPELLSLIWVCGSMALSVLVFSLFVLSHGLQHWLVASLRESDAQQQAMRAHMMQVDRMVAVGTLAAGVGHEINNPLSFVQSNLEFVEESIHELSDRFGDEFKEIHDALHDALYGAERIRKVVDDLRTISRAPAGQRESVDVRACLESALNIAAIKLNEHAQVVKFIEDVPPILGEESGLGQIFLNLLINASQAIPKERRDENVITVRLEVDGDHVVATISDTGRGISSEHLSRIFDPFFTTKAPDDGTGLGLSISQNIINEMGGLISVQSEEGKGTSFRVHLPLCSPREIGPVAPHSTAQAVS